MYINTMTFTDQRVHCGTWTVATEYPLHKHTAVAYAVAHGLAIAKSCELAITSTVADELEQIEQTNIRDVLVPYHEVGEILIWKYLDQVNDITPNITNMVVRHAMLSVDAPKLAHTTAKWASDGVHVRIEWEE